MEHMLLVAPQLHTIVLIFEFYIADATGEVCLLFY